MTILSTGFDLERASAGLPSSRLCLPRDLPIHRAPRLLYAMGLGQTLETAFSGATYHLARAGLSVQKLEGCFSLDSPEKPLRPVQLRGAMWKLAQILRLGGTQGFKFTSTYLDSVWPRYIEYLAGTTLISNFQLIGKEFFKRRKQLDIGVHFYIDGTLSEYFESYGEYDAAKIAPSTIRQAIELEQEGYAQADGIIAMSKLSAVALLERYGVPANKISVVVPGANLLDAVVEETEVTPASTETDEFILGFVGLYPIRKGLDRLAGALQILRGRGLPVRLRVIGKCPDELKHLDGLDYCGVISKRNEPAKFLNAMGSVHLGCLLSRAELAGIAMVEFLRLGVPILGCRTGGSTDILEVGGSLMVSPDIETEELAEVIAGVYHDKGRYTILRGEADNLREWASWRRAVNQLDAVLP